MNKYPKCLSNGTGVCFACNKSGRCTVLDNTVFKDYSGVKKECPFKKSQEQLKAERKAINDKLFDIYNFSLGDNERW